MEKRKNGVLIKGNTPLDWERSISTDDKYITLFTSKQIQNNFSALSRDNDELESDLNVKWNGDYTLNTQLMRNRKTRRPSILMKELQNQVFRVRPSSK